MCVYYVLLLLLLFLRKYFLCVQVICFLDREKLSRSLAAPTGWINIPHFRLDFYKSKSSASSDISF